MRLVHLAAGAGDTYCGACAGDLALVCGLTTLGHEVIVVPLYTPLRIEGTVPHAVAPVFLGGINAYLQQLSPAFSRLPGFLTRPLDNPGLLRWASRFAVRTDPARLGPMTVSVLQGRQGRQRAELDRLLDFLQSQPPPDVVSVTNSLLSAVAPAVKERFGVPVICGLQGEDAFLEAMPSRYRNQALDLIRSNARSIDRFIAPTHWYARHMTEFLGESTHRVAVVPPGVDVTTCHCRGPGAHQPAIIGYLSAITPRKGLHLLVEAVAMLVLAEGRDLHLHVAGKILDRRYWADLRRGASATALGPRLRYLGELTLAEKVRFLGSCSLFVQPSIAPEPRGMAALEAMATGLPVVAPDEGVFAERRQAGAGLALFEPRSAPSLASALGTLMDDPHQAEELGRSAAAFVAQHHSQDTVARGFVAVCTELGAASG